MSQLLFICLTIMNYISQYDSKPDSYSFICHNFDLYFKTCLISDNHGFVSDRATPYLTIMISIYIFFIFHNVILFVIIITMHISLANV